MDCGSLIHVDRNAYSVNSRLIGQKVEVRLYGASGGVVRAEEGGRTAAPARAAAAPGELPPRHRLAGAQARGLCHYRYQADLFPSSLFRVAYDRLQSTYAGSAASST